MNPDYELGAEGVNRPPYSIELAMVGCNRRVLELGAAYGNMTRALAERHCRVTAVEYFAEAAAGLKEVAEEVVVGDLNDPATLAAIRGPFEVILAGDVLEHLLDPERVLRQMVDLLGPGGRIVVSLPHIAHADVRMALLQGRFDYRSCGLLDRTHVRFFTLDTIRELVRSAGLLITDLQRVRIPAFETELGIDRGSVTTAVLNEILEDPEAETYQFVFTAVRDDGDAALAGLVEKCRSLEERCDALHVAREAESIRRSELEDRVRDLEARLHDAEVGHRAARDELQALHSTKLIRYSKPARNVWGAILRTRRSPR